MRETETISQAVTVQIQKGPNNSCLTFGFSTKQWIYKQTSPLHIHCLTTLFQTEE